MITRPSLLFAAGIVALGASRAQAQEPDQEVYSAGVEVGAAEDPNAPPEPYGPPPVPPEVEAQPVTGAGGAVCYVGPHPVDTRVAGGSAWDDTQGAHYHFYAPFDMRLFQLQGSCYYFVGDPSDFGYQGQVYSYYGAHPIHTDYGGGWCFMIGGHSHWWQPWSPSFVVVNNWYYWNGPYDTVFWTYWPYYSYYYRAYYPHYYGGGRWWRGYERHVAPRIERVPPAYARGWQGGRPGHRPAVVQGGGGGWRGGSPRTVQPGPQRVSPRIGGAAGNWSASGGGWHGATPAAPDRARPAAAPHPAPAPRAPAPAPSSSWSGGWHGGGAAAPSSGGWQGGAPSHPVPSSHPSVAPHQPSPPPATRAPSMPAPSSSGGWKGGASPSHGGGAKGGWHR